MESKNLVAIMIVNNSAVVLTDPEIGGIFAIQLPDGVLEFLEYTAPDLATVY